MKLQRVFSIGRRECGPRHERRPLEAPGGSLGGAHDPIHPPWTLNKESHDEKDGRSGSCEEKSTTCRSQGEQDQARREAGCDQTRSSGGRGSRTASPDRPESLTPPRAEDRPGAPRRRAEGRAEGRRSPRCPQGGGARQGAPRRQENRRAPRRAQGSGSRAGPSGGEEDRGSPGRPAKGGHGRHGPELADVPDELNLVASP